MKEKQLSVFHIPNGARWFVAAGYSYALEE
jgi:hypothetical protein